MREVLTLLRPRFLSFKNRRASGKLKGRRLRLFFFGAMGLLFWGGAFASLYRLLSYFRRFGFGDIVAYKFLSMALIIFFSLLLFSGILTSLSKLYLARDLSLIHAMPVSREKIFLARWIESTIDSSWMVLVYSLPLFIPFGIVYKAGFFYYAMVAANLLPFCLIASSLSSLVVMVAAVLLPAGRIRSVFFFLSLFLFLLLVISFRLMRPERFANPDSFASVVFYLRSLESSHSPLLPTTWFFDALRASLTGSTGSAFFNSGLSWSYAVTMVFVSVWISGAVYFRGLSKAQTAAVRFFSSLGLRNWGDGFLLGLLPGPVRALTAKEIKTFLRDQTQWSQILLIAALIAIYLYNFSVLPLEKDPAKVGSLQNLLSFLNMALAAFVLTAVSARLVFPAVSLEGEAFWIVKASPVPVRTFLWVKFSVYFLPLLLLTEMLVVVTNLLLDVTPFMMVLSVVTVFFMVPGIVSMGIGLGAAYPDFHSESPAQSVTSLGGLTYMTLCIGLIGTVIVLEAGPVYAVFMTSLHRFGLTRFQWVWIVGSFLAVFFICFMAVVIPMRMGEQRILEQEFGRDDLISSDQRPTLSSVFSDIRNLVLRRRHG